MAALLCSAAEDAATAARAIAGTEDLSFDGRMLCPSGTAELSLEQHDHFFHCVASCAKRGAFPSGYIGESGKAQRIEQFLGSPAGRAFLDECAGLIKPLDENVLQPGATGQLLWHGVRSVTLLIRTTVPQMAAKAPGEKCELGQEELQPTFDYALAHAAPLRAWSVKRQLAAMSDTYLLENPDAANALTAWEIGCLSLQDHGLTVWRQAHTAMVFWEAVAALPARLLLHLCTADGAAGPAGSESPELGEVPVLKALLKRVHDAEQQAWGLPPDTDYVAAVKAAAKRALHGFDLVAWVSLEPTAGRRIDVYPQEPAQLLEHAYDKLIGSQVDAEGTGGPSDGLVDVPTSFPASDTKVQLLRQLDGSIIGHQHTPSTGGMRAVARAQLPSTAGAVEFAVACWSAVGACSNDVGAASEQWELLRPGWKERGLERLHAFVRGGSTEGDASQHSSLGSSSKPQSDADLLPSGESGAPAVSSLVAAAAAAAAEERGAQEAPAVRLLRLELPQDRVLRIER